MNAAKIFVLNCLSLVSLPVLLISCNQEDNPDHLLPPLDSPSGIYLERLSETMVNVHWRDNSDGESGFSVWYKAEGDAAPTLAGDVGGGETSFVINGGLKTSALYDIGVRADSKYETLCSDIVYVPIKMIPMSSVPSATVESAVSTGACLCVTYSVRNMASLTDVETGLCWSASGKATVSDNRLVGPELSSTGKATQLLSNLYLEYGTEYNVRAYISCAEGVYYADGGEMTLQAEPEAISLNWNKLDIQGAHDGIEVFETTDQIEGKNFHAWYAVAELNGGEMEFGTNVPSSVATIDDQAASFYGDCYLMVNGGYFASGSHTGIAINNFVATGSINNQRGSIRQSDPESQETYPTTRGIFSVTSNGVADVCWANGSADNGINYFNYPVPSMKGEAKYPSSAAKWSSADFCQVLPRAAISAAPVLLKDGKCPFDFTLTIKGDGYYYTNFEFLADDIFGPEVYCDRTALGVTGDGKIVFFICDGRISSSPGITLLQLARVMKGLGCVSALNLDGGGSTGMVVGDTRLGDTTNGGNRKVMSTVGLFRKK